MKENAVIVRAGKNSQHPMWLEGGQPSFDLIVLAYEAIPDEIAARSDLRRLLPGWKVEGWDAFFRSEPNVLRDYKRVALIDDDIECDATTLNACFEIGDKFNLTLWQPSLTAESFFSYAITVSNPAFLLRYVNFVEMMCPFFKTSFLREVAPFFALGIETGVDRLWSACCPEPQSSCAVLDAVSVRHGRPVGVNRAAQGFVGDSAFYEDVLDRIHRQTGMAFRVPLTFSGLTRHRHQVQTRLAICLLSLWPLIRLNKLNGPKPLRKFGSLEKATWLNRDQTTLDVDDLVKTWALRSSPG